MSNEDETLLVTSCYILRHIER